MKRFLLIIIVTILCITGNSLYAAQEDSINVASDSVQTEENAAGQYPKLFTDTYVEAPIEINGKKYSLELLPSQEKEWYAESWVIVSLFVLVIVSLLLVAYTLSIVNKCLHKEEVKHIVNEQIRTLRANLMHVNNSQPAKVNGEYSKLQDSISLLENQLCKLNNKVSDMTSKPLPSQQSETQKDSPQSIPVVANVRKKYAFQDASNPNSLICVSDRFDEYQHTFVITLDPGSETEGSFIIIEKENVIANCLNNTDSMLCCDKEGTGTCIVKQIAGRVTIKGDTAEVKQHAKVIVK